MSVEGDALLSDGDNWTVRHGGLAPWNEDGYYSNHLLGSDDATLTPSTKNYEPSFGLDTGFRNGGAASCTSRQMCGTS